MHGEGHRLLKMLPGQQYWNIVFIFEVCEAI